MRERSITYCSKVGLTSQKEWGAKEGVQKKNDFTKCFHKNSISWEVQVFLPLLKINVALWRPQCTPPQKKPKNAAIVCERQRERESSCFSKTLPVLIAKPPELKLLTTGWPLDPGFGGGTHYGSDIYRLSIAWILIQMHNLLGMQKFYTCWSRVHNWEENFETSASVWYAKFDTHWAGVHSLENDFETSADSIWYAKNLHLLICGAHLRSGGNLEPSASMTVVDDRKRLQ